MKKHILLALFCLLFTSSWAKHIIGGVVYYECLGNGKYKFTMKIYRDCNGGGAEYDKDASISVYKGSMLSAALLTTSAENYDLRTNVNPPDLPCITLPPNICVEEAVYNWETTFADFPSKESYIVVYQRCCRNNSITNINNPQDAGATYMIEITPEAQKVCNNSPVFKLFPPTVVCRGFELNFDHSATDKDGDQLVYEFCNPLDGGGNILSSPELFSCTGAKPTPSCGPPFTNVSFKQPAFSANKPMGGNPVVKIDQFTGRITGTPVVNGQYVVGVCATDFRNGKVMSRVFRDFQFNVSECDPQVVAAVNKDSVFAKTFIINSCGSFNVEAINLSYKKSVIKNYQWEFDVLGKKEVFTTENLNYTFPQIGSYKGILIANPGQKPCTDTAKFIINIFPEIKADFEYKYDTCVAGPITFTNTSYTGSKKFRQYLWKFGDGTTSGAKDPIHVFKKPGKYDVELTVLDTNGCKTARKRTINYFPAPAVIIIEPSSFKGCVPLSVFFNNLSTPIDSTYKIEWTFGDGGVSNKISPTYTYNKIGIYDVSIKITTPIGCKASAYFPKWITVRPAPIAAFECNPESITSLNPTVSFTEKAKDAVSWSWRIGKEYSTNLRNPTYTFKDTGLYLVKLIVRHQNGCLDSVAKRIDVVPDIRYFLPNAFTPNFDSKNEEFKGIGLLDGIKDFKMIIWNRWGEQIFETDSPYVGWNGRKRNEGEMSPDGVYLYQVQFRGPRGNPFNYKGFVTLLK